MSNQRQAPNTAKTPHQGSSNKSHTQSPAYNLLQNILSTTERNMQYDLKNQRSPDSNKKLALQHSSSQKKVQTKVDTNLYLSTRNLFKNINFNIGKASRGSLPS